MSRLKKLLFIFLFLLIFLPQKQIYSAPLHITTPIITAVEDIALTIDTEYTLPLPKYIDIRTIDYEFLGDDIFIITGKHTIKTTACGTGELYIYLGDTPKICISIVVYPKYKEVSDDIFNYPYLTIDKSLTKEEKYLLAYSYDTLEPVIKETLLAYKVPIIITEEIFEEEECKKQHIVGLFSYTGNPYIIYLKADIYGIDAFLHEIGHFWSVVNGNLCLQKDNMDEFQRNPYAYKNYNPNSPSEFFASKFKQMHLKNYCWYPYEFLNGYI